MGQQLCTKCQNAHLIHDVQVADRTIEEDWTAAAYLKVEVATKPKARLFKGIVGIPLKATVCGSCGYTELYVSEPARLVEAIEERKQNVR